MVLTDVVSGKTVSLNDFTEKKGLLIMFICRHCPFVKHVEQELARLGQVSRARVTQIMDLLSLAPDIQQQILSWAREPGGQSVRETSVRVLSAEVIWSRQREQWKRWYARSDHQQPLHLQDKNQSPESSASSFPRGRKASSRRKTLGGFPGLTN